MKNTSQKFNDYFYNLVKKKPLDEITIGIEQEFFLESTSGQPCNLTQSQHFLENLTKFHDLQTKEKKGFLIKRIGQDNKNGSYNSIKYEFPPHLLEASFGYFNNLNELEIVVNEIIDSINIAAEECNLRVRHVPFILQAPIDNYSLNELEHIQLGLTANRKKIGEEKKIRDDLIVQFPAIIASTQYHIGGLDWFNSPEIIDSLYSTEPYISYLAFECVAKNEKIILTDLYKKRWQGYCALFENTELFGFPKYDKWDFETWKNAYIKNCSTQEEDIVELIKKNRDLLFIKPRHIGTLEFRSMPALYSAKSIMRFAAYRLAQSLLSAKGFNSKVTIKESFKIWNDIFINPAAYSTNIALLKTLCFEVLKERGLGEEKKLNEF